MYKIEQQLSIITVAIRGLEKKNDPKTRSRLKKFLKVKFLNKQMVKDFIHTQFTNIEEIVANHKKELLQMVDNIEETTTDDTQLEDEQIHVQRSILKLSNDEKQLAIKLNWDKELKSNILEDKDDKKTQQKEKQVDTRQVQVLESKTKRLTISGDVDEHQDEKTNEDQENKQTQLKKYIVSQLDKIDVNKRSV